MWGLRDITAPKLVAQASVLEQCIDVGIGLLTPLLRTLNPKPDLVKVGGAQG